MLNSCNPAFVQIGQRLGAEKFSEYFKAYGLTEKTGIDLPSEVSSIYMPLSRMGTSNLRRHPSDRQIKLLPIQMITAYSAVVNEDIL